MLNEPTMDKLRELKMNAFAAAWAAQQGDPSIAELSFDERIGLLVDAEALHRDNARLTRSLREAKLRFPDACIEDLDYPPNRGLDRAVVRQLATCRWVQEHQSILIIGATGTGKTYLGCAFAQQACRKGYRAMYRRVSRLIEELTLARADGTYVRMLDRIAKIDVLVLDDWGLATIPPASRQDILDVIDDRTGSRSTVVTSQLPVKLWHDHIGDPTIADAICDRLLHTSHRIELKGPTRRKLQSKAASNSEEAT